MNKYFLSLIVTLLLPLSACATTNTYNFGTLVTNVVSRMMTNQLDTNSFAITNLFGASGYNNTQFTTNNGPLQLAAGVATTNLTDGGTISSEHFSGYAYSPSVTLSANAGSTASYTMNANPTDTAFSINLTPSGSGIANGDVFTKDFVLTYSAIPTVVFSIGPVNTNGIGKISVVSAVTRTNMTFAAYGLNSGTTYTWTFHIIQ